MTQSARFRPKLLIGILAFTQPSRKRAIGSAQIRAGCRAFIVAFEIALKRSYSSCPPNCVLYAAQDGVVAGIIHPLEAS